MDAKDCLGSHHFSVVPIEEINMDENEEIISRDFEWTKPQWISEGVFPTKAIEIKRTPEGLLRREVKFVYLAACGKSIQREEIGGICSVCKKLECKEHFFLCFTSGCRRPLCVRDVYFLQTENGILPFCAPCYQYVALHEIDTWKLMDPRYARKQIPPSQ